MKATWLRWCSFLFLFLLFLSAAVWLSTRQTEADRRHLAEVRAQARRDEAERDQAEVVKKWRKAAEQNDAGAQTWLGLCYAEGRGVAKDEVEAVKWYRKAAEQNDAAAQTRLGFCYAEGRGVAKDEAEAVKWYRKGAEQNVPFAQRRLGVCYAEGVGVAKDYVEAYKWTLLVAVWGEETAKEFLTTLEDRMTREQIGECQKLARNFRPREARSIEGDRSAARLMPTHPSATCTGFFITEDGYLITSRRPFERWVGNNSNQIRVVTAAAILRARVVKVARTNDLALLKVDGSFAPVPVVSSSAVKRGSTVATVGFVNPGPDEGLAPRLAKGEIVMLSGREGDPRCFQISVPVQSGDSGGALVDERGNVVGVVLPERDSTRRLAGSMNYAVKSSVLLSFLESVPEVTAKLKEPNTTDQDFEDVVKSAYQATVFVF